MTRPRREKKSKKGFLGSVGDHQIVVNGYSEQWLRHSFDWIYSQEVMAVGKNVSFGKTAEVVTQNGQSLGTVIYSGKGPEGSVAARRFSDSKEALDLSFFIAKIQAAYNRRHIPELTSAWRLIHSENDDLPGIVVDCWERTISITVSCSSLESLIPLLMDAIQAVYPFENAVGHLRLPEGNQRYLGTLKGELSERFVVQELGLQYWVHPQLSKDAGLFLDMRPLRGWLSQRGWKNQRVLNLFCYTGAFSVSAAAHGAKQVTSVDLSNPYLERARGNFELNNLSTDGHRFLEADCFQALDRLRRKSETFDVVIADPPSFSHSNQGTWSVQSDLKRLVISCLRVLSKGGILVIATNHGKMPPRDFSKAITDAARKEKRRLRLLLNYVPGTDFPAALHFPEARYLKCWVMEAS
jgi:23S rRNA (cytosine1962-C5)-methyltransferase